MSAPTRFSIKTLKSMAYEGGTKVWSNRYFFTGSDPSGTSAWLALYNSVRDDEKTMLPASVTIESGVGYDAGSDVPVWAGGSSAAGVSVPGSTHTQAPGDCAAVVRFTTTQRSTKNHPIYLFKYYHGVWVASGTGPDVLHPDQKAQILAVANDFIGTYIVVDGTDRQLCGPRGAVGQTASVNQWVRHRDFR